MYLDSKPVEVEGGKILVGEDVRGIEEGVTGVAEIVGTLGTVGVVEPVGSFEHAAVINNSNDR